MSLPREFFEQLPNRSDLELYEMLLDDDTYLPEAQASAMDELRKRNLSARSMDEIRAAVEQSKMKVAQLDPPQVGGWSRTIIFNIASSAVLAALYALKQIIEFLWPR